MVLLALAILCLVGSVAATETGSDDTSVTHESNSVSTTTSSDSSLTAQSTQSSTSSQSSTQTTTSPQTTDSSLYSSSSSNSNKVSTASESTTTKTTNEDSQQSTPQSTSTTSTQSTSTTESTTQNSIEKATTSSDNKINNEVSSISSTSGSSITTIQQVTTNGDKATGDSITYEINNLNIGTTAVTDDIKSISLESSPIETIEVNEVTEDYESSIIGSMPIDNVQTTNIKLTDMTVEPGDTVTFKALLTTDNGSNIDNGKVAFKVNGKTVGTTSVSDGEAVFIYTIPYDWINPTYTLTAVYGASSEYESASAEGVISLYSYTKTNAKVTNITATPGNKITLTASFTTDNDQNVKHGLAAFKINNITVGYANVSDGLAQLVYQIPSTWADSTYSISVVYGETGIYKGTSGTGTLTLSQNSLKTASPSSTKVTVTSLTANSGSTVTIKATVQTTGGASVTSGKVAFKINGNTIGHSTVSNGATSLSYKIPLTWTDPSYTITVVYGGTSSYAESTGTGKLSLNAVSSTTTVTDVTTNAGTKITLQANIKLSNNATLNSGTVTFKINGNTVGTVNVSNNVAKLSYTVPLTYTNPTYTITAAYSGSGVVKSSTKNAQLSLNPVSSTTTVTDVTTNAGTKITLQANIKLSNNATLNGGKVSFKINGKTVGTVSVSNNVAKLSYTVPLTYTNPTYTITAVYGGSGIVKSSTKNAQLSLNPVSSTTTVKSITTNAGKTITLQANIKASNNATVNGGKVSFKINGKTVGTVKVSGGVAKLSYTVPSNYKDPTYTITAVYGGSGIVKSSTKTGTLTLNNVVTTSIKVTEISDYAGNTVTLKATLYAKNGSYVKEGIVAFKINGKTVGHANVSNGGAKLNYKIPSDYSSKSYTITVVYGQTGIYKSSNGTGTLKVLPKIATKVTVTDISSSSGSTITLKATITTSNGSYAKDGVVAFKINGKTVGHANVSNGGAKLNFTIPSSYSNSKYTITAVYGSSNKYEDARANGTLTIKSSSTSGMSQYLKSTTNCQVSSSTIQNIASKFDGYTNTLSKAKAIFNYLNDKTSYSSYSNTRYGAVSTWNRKAGNCCDLTHLLVAVYRACGIPARYCHATCTFNSGSTIGHVWAEVYVDGTWYKCDLTSANNSFGKINNWYKSTTVKRYATLPF